MGASRPTTPTRIAALAVERPDAVAVVDRGRAVGYAQFAREIALYTRALHELGLRRGALVAVGCEDLYLHWLLLLACEQLALVTVSFGSGELGTRELLARVDLALVEPNCPLPTTTPRFLLSDEWRRSVEARGDAGGDAGVPAMPDDPLRLIRTSGTTGLAKYLLLTRAVHGRRIGVYVAHARLDESSRFLLTMPFTVGAMYHHAKACIEVGGTVVIESFRDAADVERAIGIHGITHVILWPLQLKQMLDRLPPDFARPRALTVTSFGAALVPALRKRVLERLATAIFDYYGSNESGFIAYVPQGESGELGTPFPGVEIEIVGGDGSPLPQGRAGRIRVRSEYMASGYWNDDEATRAMFRDGWFYPGDLAELHAGPRLRLLGRGDELLNIGGGKIAPESVEEWLAKHIPARDLGVCTLRNADGIEEICVGVAEPRLPPNDILQRATFAFSTFHVGLFHIELLHTIPRNATGKIERERLRKMIAAAREKAFRMRS
ncbi:MAG TPA: class I adenylate-forming enzyme family protein [Stellaceae bacterium]|nr:class I adenylate-forming enzyme family protein [Stellaceae bacterium]